MTFGCTTALALMLSLAATGVHAQATPTPAPTQGPAIQKDAPQGQGQGRAGRMMEMLMKDITLTDAQKVKVDSIVASYRAQMPAFTPGQPMDDAARAKRREISQAQNAAIRAVLTDAQKTTFDANVQAAASMRRGGGAPPE